jgi:hypothetical protein
MPAEGSANCQFAFSITANLPADDGIPEFPPQDIPLSQKALDNVRLRG